MQVRSFVIKQTRYHSSVSSLSLFQWFRLVLVRIAQLLKQTVSIHSHEKEELENSRTVLDTRRYHCVSQLQYNRDIRTYHCINS